MERMTKKELKSKLAELRERALDSSTEGFVYLRNDGKISFSFQVPQYTNNSYEVIAAHETPMRHQSGLKKGLSKIPEWELEEYETIVLAHHSGKPQ